jgi:hypothetical protein
MHIETERIGEENDPIPRTFWFGFLITQDGQNQNSELFQIQFLFYYFYFALNNSMLCSSTSFPTRVLYIIRPLSN